MHPKLKELPAWASPWPGKAIIRDLPAEQYHGTKSIISKSGLDIFGEQSPLHYLASLDADPEVRTEAMAIGSAFHVRTLEPDLYNKKICVLPDFGDMRSSRNREVRDAFIRDEAGGKEVIKAEQHELVCAMADSVRRHPAAKRLLSRGESEVTALWTDPDTGLPCKSRGDYVSDMAGVFVDLKSALSAAPHEFKRAAANNRYHVQDAFYSRAFEENGIHIKNFVFVVVEKEPPYAVACYQLDETARLKGEELYMAELRRLRQCIDTDTWPGYGDAIIDLALPGWATMTEST